MLDMTKALRCAKASKLAYSTPETVNDELAALDIAGCDVRFIEKGNHAAVILDFDECSVFAYRGTELDDIEDLLTDVRIQPVKSDFGYVHKGFWEATNRFLEELQRFGASDTKRALYLTGHSLGGAMACLSAVLLDSALDGVYTFAQPPTGTREFGAKYLNRFAGSYYRIVNVLDDIPGVPVPFVDAAKAIRPVGSAFELYLDGQLRSAPSFFLKLADRWAAARNPSRRYKFVLHSMDEHIRRLSLTRNAS